MELMASASVARQDAPSDCTDDVLQELLSHRLWLYPVLARPNLLLESSNLVPTDATPFTGDFHRLPPTAGSRQELSGYANPGTYAFQCGDKSLAVVVPLDLPRLVAQG